MAPIRLICLDADDTLWGHESYFQQAWRAYADLLAPFADRAISEERLIAIEDRNLHLYGYGVKGFTLSMLETALEIAGERLTAATTRAILEIGRDLMRHPIDLLDGVAEALGPLAKRGKLVLVTKGDLFHQEIEARGVRHRRSVLRRRDRQREERREPIASIFAATAPSAEEAVMVGNSLRSDILPGSGGRRLRGAYPA